MYAPSPVAHSVDGLSEPGSAFEQQVRLLRSDVGVLKGLTWRRTAYTFLAAAGFALWTAFGNWMLMNSGWYGMRFGPVEIADFFVHKGWGFLFAFRVYLLMFFSQVLALTVADNLRIPHVPRTVLLVVALVVGTALGSVAIMTTGNYLSLPPAFGLTWGGLIALVYFNRRRDEELAAALHATQMAQVELKQKALESQLQLMQARVEPTFLFNTLQRVDELYENDTQSADCMLENLIVYLRAVLPQMRTSSSTLGQEVRLARAYLNIERIRLHGRLDFAFDIPDRLNSAVLPPMVLLPLIEALALRDRAVAGDGNALRAEACVTAGMLQLTLTATHLRDVRPATDEIECIRSRLTALFGVDGKLRLEPLNPQGAVVTMELPYVAA